MVCFALAAALAPPTLAAGKLLDWPDLLGRPLPQASERIAYGPGPLQFAELWLPAGKGPFPVVLMVHGGCWQSGVAKLSIMNYIADDLRQRGYAVWNIEYRGVDRPGGGYPGSFQDVAAGADKLAEIAPAHRLNLRRLVALGHSAGGHFVLWLAARGRIAEGGALHAAAPLPIAASISTGGLPDLEAVHAQDICGRENVEKLVGAPSVSRANVYADTSPAELGVGHDREVLISGDQDPIAPPKLAIAYKAKMKHARLTSYVIPDTGHVELITPGTAAWAKTVQVIASLVG